MSHQCEQSNKSAVSDYKPLLIVSSQPYPTLPYTTPNPTKHAPYLVQSHTLYGQRLWRFFFINHFCWNRFIPAKIRQKGINLSSLCKFGTTFYNIHVRELEQRRRQRQRERQKSNRFRQERISYITLSWFRLAKQQLCMRIMLFSTFPCRRCTTTKWKCLTSRFVDAANEDNDFLFLFLNFDTVF